MNVYKKKTKQKEIKKSTKKKKNYNKKNIRQRPQRTVIIDNKQDMPSFDDYTVFSAINGQANWVPERERESISMY